MTANVFHFLFLIKNVYNTQIKGFFQLLISYVSHSQEVSFGPLLGL